MFTSAYATRPSTDPETQLVSYASAMRIEFTILPRACNHARFLSPHDPVKDEDAQADANGRTDQLQDDRPPIGHETC